jgi:hypothetical protein
MAGDWSVCTEQPLAQFAKVAGANVLGGVRCNPDQELVRVLDPFGQFREVYSRYAEISFLPAKEVVPTFELTSIATYNVHLPITRKAITQLGVRYVLEVDMLGEEGLIPGFEKIGAVNDCRIFRATSVQP